MIRQKFSAECENTINDQIRMELSASYAYLGLFAYFDSTDVALPGFAKMFKEQSDEEKQHATKLVEYQNMRGGKVQFDKIEESRTKFESPLEAVEFALEMEKLVNENLLRLHKVAERANDPQFADFIATEYLQNQVEEIKKLGDLITRMKTAGDGIGVIIIDQELSKN